MKQKLKYTKELLDPLVIGCYSCSELARRLGLAPLGGTISHLKKRCIILGVDISHFTGQVHNKGKQAGNRKTGETVLRDRQNETRFPRRTPTTQLKRALLEKGVIEQCVECGTLPIYNGLPLVLHIDHIDGNYLNNLIENLRFLCPNCHTQTSTFTTKLRVTDADILNSFTPGITLHECLVKLGVGVTNKEFKNRVSQLSVEVNFSFKTYEKIKVKTKMPVCVCGNDCKSKTAKFCSPKCVNESQRKCVISSSELYDLFINKNMSKSGIARIYNVSSTIIKKWLDKYEIK